MVVWYKFLLLVSLLNRAASITTTSPTKRPVPTAKPSSLKMPPKSEITFLQDLFLAAFGNIWNTTVLISSSNKLHWNFPVSLSSNVCLWVGITCDQNQHIIKLELPSFNLTGSIPQSIGYLEYLNILNLTSNYLNSSIPSTISKLRRLQLLDLSNNLLQVMLYV